MPILPDQANVAHLKKQAKMLIRSYRHGARVTGSNALYRAMDLREPTALELLLAHGGDAHDPARLAGRGARRRLARLCPCAAGEWHARDGTRSRRIHRECHVEAKQLYTIGYEGAALAICLDAPGADITCAPPRHPTRPATLLVL